MKMHFESTGPGSADFFRCEKKVARMDWGVEWQQPYLHPVYSPRSLEPITVFGPCDHPWHRGLWWSWKYVNNVNFWDPHDRPKPDMEFGRSAVVAQTVTEIEDDVRISQELHLRKDRDGGIVARESRVLTFGAQVPGVDESEDFQAWALDWDASWGSDQDLKFWTTPYPEYSWGGYAGLLYRPARSMMWGEEIANSEGALGNDVHAAPARWALYRGGIDGDPHGYPGKGFKVGTAILFHPENMEGKNHFFMNSFRTGESAFGTLKSSPLMYDAIRLKAGDNLRLRHRVIFFDGAGELPRQQLDAAWEAFAAE